MHSMSTVLKLKMLDSEIEVPRRAHPTDAGLDLRTTHDLDIAPGERANAHLGVAIALEDGYMGFLQPRSGLAMKQGLSIVNTPGLIDSHYRGELIAILLNTDKERTIHLKRGDRVAQLVVVPQPEVDIQYVADLDVTDRDVDGYGSSGID